MAFQPVEPVELRSTLVVMLLCRDSPLFAPPQAGLSYIRFFFYYLLFTSSVTHKAKSHLMWLLVLAAALSPSSSALLDVLILLI